MVTIILTTLIQADNFEKFFFKFVHLDESCQNDRYQFWITFRPECFGSQEYVLAGNLVRAATAGS